VSSLSLLLAYSLRDLEAHELDLAPPVFALDLLDAEITVQGLWTESSRGIIGHFGFR